MSVHINTPLRIGGPGRTGRVPGVDDRIVDIHVSTDTMIPHSVVLNFDVMRVVNPGEMTPMLDGGRARFIRCMGYACLPSFDWHYSLDNTLLQSDPGEFVTLGPLAHDISREFLRQSGRSVPWDDVDRTYLTENLPTHIALLVSPDRVSGGLPPAGSVGILPLVQGIPSILRDDSYTKVAKKPPLSPSPKKALKVGLQRRIVLSRRPRASNPEDDQ